MTIAAEKFRTAIETAWDNRDQYAQTAEKGLSDTDSDALRAMCDETGDDFDETEQQVMTSIRSHLAS